MSNNPFIDQEMNNETTKMMKPVKHQKEILKRKIQKFLYARAVHVLNVYRINSILEAERLSIIEEYKGLVKQETR